MSELVPQPISYLLYLEDDAIPIENNMTLGNHLDNDVIVPGEDVLDYHLRISLEERGPVAIPLGNATLSVNGHELVGPAPLIIGDVVGIGQITMQIGVEVEIASDIDHWWLEATNGSQKLKVLGEISVGRSDTQDLVLADEHISRNHARLVEKQGYVWLQDLGSANGCYVNAEQIRGGVRLFHGDFVRFDTLEFQLIGSGSELTPIREHTGDPFQPISRATPLVRQDTTQIAPAQGPGETESVFPESALTAALAESTGSFTGACLVQVTEQGSPEVYRLPVGESVIGRGEHCDIVLHDPSVSNQHARLSVRPEGVSLTNLLATNGTRVNQQEVSQTHLSDGDILNLGAITLRFSQSNEPQAESEGLRHSAKFKVGIAAGLVVGALCLGWLGWLLA